MKKAKPLFLALLFCICFAANSMAGSGLGFGAYPLSKDTLQFGDTLYIRVSITNTDITAYNAIIAFGLKINGIQNVDRDMFPNPLFDSLVSIPGGDSVATLIH